MSDEEFQERMFKAVADNIRAKGLDSTLFDACHDAIKAAGCTFVRKEKLELLERRSSAFLRIEKLVRNAGVKCGLQIDPDFDIWDSGFLLGSGGDLLSAVEAIKEPESS
jgi:hypothetical protein